MSGVVTITELGRQMQLAGMIAGAPGSRIHILNAANQTLVVILLGVPCAELVGGFLVFNQVDPEGDTIIQTGTAVTAIWRTLAGDDVASGNVTVAAGDGPFKLHETTGTTLRLGGKAILGDTAFS